MDEITGWIASEVKCDLCGHEWVASFLHGTERLECPNCENIVEYEIIEDNEAVG